MKRVLRKLELNCPPCDHEPKVGQGLCRQCYGRAHRKIRLAERDNRPTLICLRCGHQWKRKSWDRDPKFCRNCSSNLWNIPYQVERFGERFNIFLELIAIETDECVEWPYGATNGGYGWIYNKGVHVRAHVASWEIINKREVPEGIEVCHSCDNPPCINERHLFLGTHHDNMVDAGEKGRLPRGERHHWAKLTEKAVREMRQTVGLNYRELAEKFKVGQMTVWYILNRKTWKHLD